MNYNNFNMKNMPKLKLHAALFRPLLCLICLAGISVSTLANIALLVDNGVYTTDTVTGLDWLDLTETRGLSYDNVAGELGAGGNFQGWRFASRSDVTQFWLDAGGTEPFTGLASGSVNWVGKLQYMWGRTYPFLYTVNGKVVQGTIAMTSDAHSECAECNLTVVLLDNIEDSSSLGDYAKAGLDGAYRSDGQVPIGMALIRESSSTVPEPATYALILAGLGVMGALARRRKEKEA